MKLLPQLRSSASSLIVASLLVTCCRSSQAADLTWSGGGTTPDWSVGANWAGSPPANGDNLVFTGASRLVNTNDLTNLAIGWLQFATGDFWLLGNSLTNSGGITNISGNNALGMNLTLGAAQTFESQSGMLTLTGTVANAGSALTIAGAGEMTISNAISGTGGLVKNGSGTLYLSGAAATANTFTGGLIVNEGIVVSTKANGSTYGGSGNGNVVVNSGGTFRASGDNSLVGQTTGASKSIQINAGGTVDNTGTTSCHLNPVVLNGGTLSATTPNGTWGNWNLDFGVSTLGNGSSSFISGGNVTLGQAGGSVFNIGANDTVNVSSVIAKTTSAADLGLIKSGVGILELSAENTYASPTTISNGTLRITIATAITASPTINVRTNGVFDVGFTAFSLATNQTLAGSGDVTGTIYDNNASSYISPGGNGVAGTLRIDSLNLGGNLTLKFDLANVTTVGGVNDLMVVTNLTLSAVGANGVEFGFLNGSPAIGTYTLIQYVSGPAAGPITALSSTASRYNYAFTSDGTSIKVTVTGNPASLVWKGDGINNLWDIVTTPNWLKGGVADVFYQADEVIFNDIGSNNTPINIVAGVQPTTLTASASKDYALTGAGKVTGGAKLVKSGTGTLTVATDNDYSGGTTVSAGTLAIGAGAGTGNLAGGVGTNNARIVVNRTGTMTSAASLSGTGSLVLANTATVNLTGTNTFTGGTLVNSGSLQIGNNPPVAGASIAGRITNYSAVYFGRSDAFTLQSPVTSAGNSFINGPGQLYLRTTAGMTVDGTAGIDLAGTLNVSQDVPGRLFIAPGASINLGGEILVGNPASTSGEVIQTGGTVNVGNRMRLGHWGTEVSYYTMGGGTLNVANLMNVGWDGIGIFTLTNGTVNCLQMAVDGNGNTGALNGTNETFSITGGRINIGQGGITTASTDGGYAVLLGGGTFGANANWSSSLAMRLTNGPGVTFDTGPNTVTLTGYLSGTNGLTKQGTGYLNINNATNNYSGPTVVAQGALQGSGTVPGPVTVQTGAALSAGATSATGTLTVSNNVSFDPGARLVIDASSTAATSDRVDVRGSLSLDAGGTPAYFNFLGAQPFTGGAYTIVSNLLPRTGTLTLVNPTRYAAALDQSNPNRIQVSFTGSNASLVWKGNVNNLWDVGATANWLNGGTASTYYQSDVVVFDSVGSGTPNVALASEITPAVATVSAATDYTFSGAGIAGLGTLIKAGAGKLTLANNNTFTGSTTVGGGTLQIGDGGTSGGLVGNIANNGVVVFNRSDANTYAGAINGSGSLIQSGAGKLTLTGNSGFTGGTTVNPGTILQIGAGLNAGAAGIGPIDIQPGGTLVVFRNDSPTVANQLNGSGAINLVGTGQTGAGSGQSSYTLSASNTFSGTVTLNQVRLNPANAYALGTVGTYIVPANSTMWPNVAGAVFTPSLTISGSGWAENAGYLGAMRFGNGCTWAGSITLSGSARISAYNDANNNQITGTINGGNYEMDFGAPGAGSGQLTLAPSSPNTFGVLRVSPGTLIAGNANALPASLPLTMSGGTLRLNGNNLTATSFLSPGGGSIQNGSTNVPATITLNVNDPVVYGGTFADGSTVPLAVVKNGNGLLTLTAISTSLGGVTVNGGSLALNNGGGNGTVKGTLIANPGTTILSLNNDSLGYNGGNNQVTNLILNGATMIHTPNNNLTFWQNLVINMTGAYLAATNTGGAARLDFGTGASVNTLASATSSTIFSTGTAGTGSGVYLRQANTVFTVADGAAANDLVINAPINQAAAGYGITKNGPGRLYIAGSLNYTGPTTVNGGSLVLGPNATLAGTTGNITVGSGATLDTSGASTPGLTLQANQVLAGSGTFIGSVTDGSTSVIRPGSSAGTLTINGDLNLGGLGSLEFELANVNTIGSGVNDLIQVNGNVSLNDFSPTVVNFTFLNGSPAAGNYTLIKYTGSLIGSVPAGITNAAGYIASFSHDAGTKEIRVAFSTPAQSLVWEGDGSVNTWDLTASSIAWYNGSVNTNFYQANTVRFDDSRTIVNTTVTIGDAVKPSSITFDSTNNYSFVGTGKITGVTTITKNNTNTVVMTARNEAIGPINVNAGTYALGDNDTYVGATTITVANGAAFNFGGMNDNVIGRAHDFVIAGVGPDGQGSLRNELYDIYEYANVSNLTLTADSAIGSVTGARWDIGPAANSKLDGRGYNLTKLGTGEINLRAQTITNVNSITVSNGTLFYENYDQTNTWTATTTNYVKPGATLSAYGARTINMPVVLDGARIQSRNSTPVWTGPFRIQSGSVFDNINPQLFYGPISGPGAMWVDGGRSALTFTNASTYAGGTVISNMPINATGNGASGTAAVIASHPSALGTGPVALSGGSFYPWIATNTLATNCLRAIELNLSGGAVFANDIVLPSTLITNVSIQGRDATSILTLGGKITGGYPYLTNWFDNGTGNVGVIRLSNPANDFVVGRIALNRGTLALTADGNLGNSGNVLFPVANSTVRFDAPDMTLSHPIFAANNPTYLNMFGDNNGDGVAETVNNVTIDGVISGGGTIFPRGTNSTLTLSGANTFSGGFELQQPLTLQVGASANLGTAYVAIKFGSTFRYTGTGSETMTRTLWMDNNGGGTIDIPNASAALTWNPGAGTVNQNFTKTGLGGLVYGGAIGGNAAVTLSGGTLTLNAANTYSGLTLVNSGTTLFVNGSIAAGSSVRVASGATLGGTGTINCPVDMQAGSLLKPGVNGIGTLNIVSPLALSSSTATTMEISGTAGTSDRVASLSTVIYGGTLTVNNITAEPPVGAKFTLFSAVDRLGSFSSVTLPTLTAPRYWTNMLAIDGSITVLSTVNTTPTNIVVTPGPGNVTLSWPSDYLGWRLEAQTNAIATGLSNNWITVPGSTSTTSVVVPLDPANPTVFYRLVYP